MRSSMTSTTGSKRRASSPGSRISTVANGANASASRRGMPRVTPAARTSLVAPTTRSSTISNGSPDGASGLPNDHIGNHTHNVRTFILHLESPGHPGGPFPRGLQHQTSPPQPAMTLIRTLPGDADGSQTEIGNTGGETLAHGPHRHLH